MEYHLDIGKESGMPNVALHQSCQNKKFDKQERHFDDFHPDVIKSADDPLSKNKGCHRKQQQVGKKVHESEEVVKYMSKLPSFLERGENLPDKAFSVGVLDWGLLEKWQHSRNESTPRVDKSICHDTKKRLKDQGSKSHVQRIPETMRSEHDNKASSSKGKTKVQHEVMTGREEIQVTSCKVADRCCTKQNKMAILFPRDGLENRYSAVSDPPCSSKGDDQRSADVNRHGLAGESHFSDCPTDVPRQVNENTKLLTEIKQTESSLGNSSLSPSRGTKLEEKNLGRVNKELNLKTGISSADKVRVPSPTRRFSFDMGKMGSSPCLKETSQIPRSMKGLTIKSVLDVTCDKSNDNSRSRSSPLRRLLDPFMKPKAVKSDHFSNSLERDSSSTTDSVVKSSTTRGGSQASHFVNIKLDLKGCKTIDIANPHNEKNGSSTVQALLQVAVKNGLPLFTFAVDNNREILAATMKTLSSKKSTNCWLYTFFSVQEMKNKNRHWIHQGCKDKNHGYIPNVVAQMRVSDVLSSKSCRRSTREFVLYSTGTRDVDHQTSEFLPIDELAAVIMKFPGKIDNEGNQRLVTSEDISSLTVVLPGGDHGLPGKGEPSPLIERWKSGGSCDCGGWDMGCKIQVLANQGQSSERCSSAERRFELFSQDETPEKKAIFSLSKFKDGIFSVEFSSSIKLQQAFSIGIAFLNSMKPAIFSETNNVVGYKPSEETTLSEDNMVKVSNQDGSVKYTSFPPLSPFGRV